MAAQIRDTVDAQQQIDMAGQRAHRQLRVGNAAQTLLHGSQCMGGSLLLARMPGYRKRIVCIRGMQRLRLCVHVLHGGN